MKIPLYLVFGRVTAPFNQVFPNCKYGPDKGSHEGFGIWGQIVWHSTVHNNERGGDKRHFNIDKTRRHYY